MALPATSVIGVEDAESAWGPVQGYMAKRTAAGTKTDTALVEAPRSISVATREQMDDRNAHSTLTPPCATCRASPPAATAATPAPTRLRCVDFEPTQFLDGLPLPKGVYANPMPGEPGTSTAWPCCAARPRPCTARPRQAACWTWSAVAPSAEASSEIKLQYGSDNHRQINFASTGTDRRRRPVSLRRERRGADRRHPDRRISMTSATTLRQA